MGRTNPKGGQAFQVVYEGAKNPTFAPGDTIIGHCRRQLPLVSTNATIKVTLCGRTKSKITISSGNSTSYYRGRFTVIDENAHLQTIFQGPIHIASGEGARTWPFAIDIPTHCCPKRLVNAAPEKQSYLPLDAATIATHRLPDSFEMHHSGFSSTRDGFVEYFIKATLDYMHHGSWHSEHAIFPFSLTMTTNEPPITDFSLQRRRILRTVTSFKLLPDMEKTELTFSQKRQTFFNSLKVPRIGGHMEITVPRLVQIGNTSPIPIQLRFVPTPDDRFTTPDMRGIPVKIILSSLHMEIEARTEVRCEATFNPRDADDKEEHRVQLWPQLMPPGQLARDPLYIPYTSEWPAIDVGEMLGLRILSATKLVVANTRRELSPKLQPDFTTYNIRHVHSATLELVVLVAGEQMKMKVQWQLVILPPPGQTPGPAGISAVQVDELPPPPFEARSASWIRPPAEADAPPAFAEVQKEDMAMKKSHDG